MKENKSKPIKRGLADTGFTVKGLMILLAFSFVATILAFSVACIEHRQYTQLVDKYDDAMVRISECEASVEALINNAVAVAHTEKTTAVTTTVTVAEDSESIGHTQAKETAAGEDKYKAESSTTSSQSTTAEPATKEKTTVYTETSSTYYVTQSGKKYHVASCSYLSKSKIGITMDRIKSEGYTPCSRCIK